MTSARWIVRALLLVAAAGTCYAQQQAVPDGPATGPVFVSEPSVPTLTPAVRDLPDFVPNPNLFGLEMKRREDFGFTPVPYAIEPKVDPLIYKQDTRAPLRVDGFNTLIHNYAGQTSPVSPPDTVGDVGPNHFVQAVNQSVSTIQVLSKATGQVLKTFTLESLTTASPCRSGFCDPVVNYDRVADRWILSELPGSGGNVCVYVSQTPDPTGAYYAYSFAVEGSTTDYPKYGVWPQNGNAGSYLMGANAGSSGRDVFAFDRAKMLTGQPATFQKFSVPNLPNSGFQLVLPSTMQGPTAPPNGEPALFLRPRDDEAQDNAHTSYDLLEMWTLTVDWATPSNSKLQQLTSLQMSDYDMTLCGLGGTWNCMPQPGTGQKIDPIREPLHFPFVYRNFGDHQSLVGTFVEDSDGTDHAALRWFELRKTAPGGWTLFQEGVVGGEANVHRSIGSITMDASGNIAMGYTRTGTNAPYYPSLYYRGRLASDPLGTMPQGEFPIADATTSKTDNERYGDYAGIGIDPVDDCTFWFTSEYGGQGNTKVAAFKFDACGCAGVVPAPNASASAPRDNRIDVSWNDSSDAGATQYTVWRSLTAGGPYTQIATVPDSSPGSANGPSYTYHDDTVSGGARYYYVIRAADANCGSPNSNEASALATGACTLAPAFAGVAAVTNAGQSTCTLTLNWAPATSYCAGGSASYNVYRDTTAGFTPSAANRLATGVQGTSFTDATGVAQGTTYYYVVRAVDSVDILEDGNTVHAAGAPTGPITPQTWTDTFEGSQSGGGFDRAGWSHNAIGGATDWAWSTARKNDGTHSWFAQSLASVSDRVLVTPSFGVGPQTTLSFWHTYQFQGPLLACPDGGTLEVTIDGGTTWTVVPDGDFTQGGFNGGVGPTTGNPIAGKRAWCTGTLGPMTQVVVNLGADATLLGKSVRVRWHAGDDKLTASAGWYVDTVNVANAQLVNSCTAGTRCTAPGAPSLTTAAGDCHGVNLAWTPGAGSAAGYDVYRGFAAGGPYAKLAGMPVGTTSYADATASIGTTYYYVVTGACDAQGFVESGFSNERAGTPVAGAGPAAGVGLPNKTTVQWASTPGATAYDVVRGSVAQLRAAGSFSSAVGACVGNDVAATSLADAHLPPAADADWWLVRAVNSCGPGTYDESAPGQKGPRDAQIGASPNACP